MLLIARRKQCVGVLFAVLVTLVGVESVAASMLVSTGLNGSLGYSFRSAMSTNGIQENQGLLNASINNTFFVWQDWFASGYTYLNLAQEDRATTEGTGGTQSLTGKVGLNVLSQSRMPFTVNYGRSDSRIKPDAEGPTIDADDHIVTDSFGLSQSYVGDNFRVRLSHSSSLYNSSKQGKFGNNDLDLNTMWRQAGSMLKATVNIKDSSSYDKTQRDSQMVSLDHGYTGIQRLTINTTYSNTKMDQASGSEAAGDLYTHTLKMDQASSMLVWRSPSLKTRITGGLRYFGVDSIFIDPTKNNKMGNVTSNLGVVHRFTDFFDMSASMVRVDDALNSSENRIARDQIGARYRSDRIELGKFTYNWRVSADVSQREEGEIIKSDNAVSLGHVISRDWFLAGKQRVMFRGSQDFAVNSTATQGAGSEERQRMGHKVSVGWSENLEAVKRRAQFGITDRRDLNAENSMLAISLDLNQENKLSRRAKLSGNLNYQVTSYEYAAVDGSDGSKSTTNSLTIAGNFSYLNPFSIAGMVFNSDYRYSQSVVANSGSGLTDQQVWNNRLIYRVGKIDTSLQYMYRQSRKIGYNMVYFNVKRVF